MQLSISYQTFCLWLGLGLGTTRKTTAQLVKILSDTTPKRLISYLLSNCLFFYQVFLFISYKAGKAKRIEKPSAHSRQVKQVFLQYKITNSSNNRTISQDVCTLFARNLHSTLCSWIISKHIESLKTKVCSLYRSE